MNVEHALADLRTELNKLRRSLDQLEATLSRLDRQRLDDGY